MTKYCLYIFSSVSNYNWIDEAGVRWKSVFIWIQNNDLKNFFSLLSTCSVVVIKKKSHNGHSAELVRLCGLSQTCISGLALRQVTSQVKQVKRRKHLKLVQRGLDMGSISLSTNLCIFFKG